MCKQSVTCCALAAKLVLLCSPCACSIAVFSCYDKHKDALSTVANGTCVATVVPKSLSGADVGQQQLLMTLV